MTGSAVILIILLQRYHPMKCVFVDSIISECICQGNIPRTHYYNTVGKKIPENETGLEARKNPTLVFTGKETEESGAFNLYRLWRQPARHDGPLTEVGAVKSSRLFGEIHGPKSPGG